MGRILAVRFDNAGDLVMLGPALRALARRAGLPIVLVGHPREAETIAAIKSAARSRQVLVPPGETSLEQIAALVARARLLVANNAGPMHLADAVRCPMVPAREVVQACEEILARTAHRLPAASPPLRRARRTAGPTGPRRPATRRVPLGSEGAEP